MELIEQQLTDLSAELKTFAAKAQDETKSIGAMATETKTALGTIQAKIAELQTQVDAIDAKGVRRPSNAEERKGLGQLLTEHPEFLERKGTDFAGRKPLSISLPTGAFTLQTKTDILESTIGNGTSGVIGFNRLPGIVDIAEQSLRIRDVMNVIPMATGNSFDYVYESTRTDAPSPQVEGSAKAQSYYAWLSASGAVREIAHFVNVSRQSLADLPWLRSKIDSRLTYGLKVKEEAEILSGDGTGVHLNGLITAATAFDTTLLVASAGYTRLDVLRYAKLQARLAGLSTYAPSAMVLNPTDMAKIELTKDSYGRYIVGDPQTGMQVKFVWGLPVVESDSIAVGTFLIGAFNTAADLIDRQQVSIEISFEHDTNFTKNMATILCEERIGLAITKAGAFIKGSFVSSPATT
jgi:HK97 family phage major capsid protein